MNEKFFIYKSAYITDEKPDVSFVPMMTRRKLSSIARISFALFNECCLEKDVNLVFASHFGEVDRLNSLIEQYLTEGEVSPVSFGSSVHNASSGAFSLFRGIKNKYNAASAGKNSLSNGLLEAICEEGKTVFCYADTIPSPQGAACFICKDPAPDADKIEIIYRPDGGGDDEFGNFVKFLNKTSDEFITPLYTLRRVK